MLGRRKPAGAPAATEELSCSFCRKSEKELRTLIAGPAVWICDECVKVCVDILADDRKKTGQQDDAGRPGLPFPDIRLQEWPRSDAWCSLCANVAELDSALMIEDRALLCASCLDLIATAAEERRQP